MSGNWEASIPKCKKGERIEEEECLLGEGEEKRERREKREERTSKSLFLTLVFIVAFEAYLYMHGWRW
jgi:hypothetical protein